VDAGTDVADQRVGPRGRDPVGQENDHHLRVGKLLAQLHNVLALKLHVRVAIALPERHRASRLLHHPLPQIFVRHKQQVAVFGRGRHDPLRVAAALGGRELAAILGAALAARRYGIPVILDGFVCTAAVAPLYKLRADTLAHTIAGHVSAEAGHRMLLDELKLKPLLDLNMRLGEASGAAVALSLLRAALACHTGMATFAEAGVSDKPADEAAKPKAAG